MAQQFCEIMERKFTFSSTGSFELVAFYDIHQQFSFADPLSAPPFLHWS